MLIQSILDIIYQFSQIKIIKRVSKHKDLKRQRKLDDKIYYECCNCNCMMEPGRKVFYHHHITDNIIDYTTYEKNKKEINYIFKNLPQTTEYDIQNFINFSLFKRSYPPRFNFYKLKKKLVKIINEERKKKKYLPTNIVNNINTLQQYKKNIINNLKLSMIPIKLCPKCYKYFKRNKFNKNISIFYSNKFWIIIDEKLNKKIKNEHFF